VLIILHQIHCVVIINLWLRQIIWKFPSILDTTNL